MSNLNNAAQHSNLAQSPCVSICLLDDNDICKGCFRSAKEITYWGTYDEPTKIAVNRLARQRASQSSYKL